MSDARPAESSESLTAEDALLPDIDPDRYVKPEGSSRDNPACHA
jgi:hypothetical protein